MEKFYKCKESIKYSILINESNKFSSYQLSMRDPLTLIMKIFQFLYLMLEMPSLTNNAVRLHIFSWHYMLRKENNAKYTCPRFFTWALDCLRMFFPCPNMICKPQATSPPLCLLFFSVLFFKIMIYS